MMSESRMMKWVDEMIEMRNEKIAILMIVLMLLYILTLIMKVKFNQSLMQIAPITATQLVGVIRGLLI